MSELTISSDKAHALTFENSCKVLVKGAVVIDCCGEQVASVDAEYDISGVNSEYHELILGMLDRRRLLLEVPDPELEAQRIARVMADRA